MSVLNRSIYLALKVFVLILLIACSDCNDNDNMQDYSDDCEICVIYTIPDYCDEKSDIKSGNARFLVKTDSLNSNITVKVFKGNVEDQNKIYQGLQGASAKTIELGNGEYSVVAIYKTENEDLVVIKSFEIKPEAREVDDCEVCYYRANIAVDLWPDQEAEIGE